MPNRQVPVSELNFWWMRHGLGIVVPIIFIGYGIYSIITEHSYALSTYSGRRGLHFVPVQGEQAVLMGVAYLGMALTFFANCYAQYHDKMGFYYQWLSALGGIMVIGGMGWCTWIFYSN